MKSIRSFFNDFSDFIAGSNFIEVAVGVLIAGAIKDIANSFTSNIISPLFSFIAENLGITIDQTSKINFFGIQIGLSAFLSSIVTFFMILFVSYIIIKIYARFKERVLDEKK
ncbi:MAG: MscL family protein, partial [Mycoplasmatales bacterium]